MTELATQTTAPHFRTLSWTRGFLESATFRFSPHLNVIIGERGVGKSTTLESIRYLSGAPVSQPKRAAALEQLMKQNLGAGTICLDFLTAHGARYRAERAYGERTRILNDSGKAVSTPLNAMIRFDFYGQNELDDIASDPSAQLALLARFVEDDIREHNTKSRRVERELQANAAELTRLSREVEALRAAETELTRLQTVAIRFHTDTKQRLSSAVDAELERGPNSGVIGTVVEELARVAGIVETAFARVADEVKNTEARLETARTALSERHAVQEASYRTLLEQTNEATGRAAERTKVQERYAALVTAKKNLEARQAERQTVHEERKKLLAQLVKLRTSVFDLRKCTAERLTKELAPDINVTVSQAGNRDAYEALLIAIFKARREDSPCLRPSNALKLIANSISPDDLCALVVAGDLARLVEKIGLTTLMANRVIDTVRASGRLYDLETVALEDEPTITLRHGRSPFRSAIKGLE